MLDRLIAHEADERVALEMAASAARLGAASGIERISATVWSHQRTDLRMEGVLILSELAVNPAGEELRRIASATEFAGSEIRQAAVWGLGHAGARAYHHLVDFIEDEDQGVALHAIVAFGSDTPDEVIETLVTRLLVGTHRARAAAVAALRIINSAPALEALIRIAKQATEVTPWPLAAIGCFPAARVRAALAGDVMLTQVEPLLALGADENWLAHPAVMSDFNFLRMQKL